MVYGIIQDFYTTVKGEDKSVVKFLVKSEAEATANGCTVCAEIPNDALKYDMVKTGSTIGWEDPKVFIEIEGVEDVAFKKVSNQCDIEEAYLGNLRITNGLEEKGSKGIQGNNIESWNVQYSTFNVQFECSI